MTAVVPDRDDLAALRQHLDALLAEQYQRFYKVILRQVKNEADAADLLQDTLLIAYSQLGSFNGEAQLSSWVHGIAKNIIRGHRNRWLPICHLHCEFDEDIAADLEGAGDPLDTLIARESLANVAKAFDLLPKATQEAMKWALDNDGNYEELARRLDTTAGTLKSRVSRGRALLRQKGY